GETLHLPLTNCIESEIAAPVKCEWRTPRPGKTIALARLARHPWRLRVARAMAIARRRENGKAGHGQRNLHRQGCQHAPCPSRQRSTRLPRFHPSAGGPCLDRAV